MRLIAIILLIALGFCSCEKKATYSSKIDIEEEFWSYEKQLDFEITPIDTGQVYELQLLLDHTKTYSFENIYLKVFTHFPDGKIKEEQLSIDLANKAGKWIGKCRNDGCQLRVYLLEEFKFPEKGNYRFSFSQHSRTENLKGINSLELKLFKVEKPG